MLSQKAFSQLRPFGGSSAGRHQSKAEDQHGVRSAPFAPAALAVVVSFLLVHVFVAWQALNLWVKSGPSSIRANMLITIEAVIIGCSVYLVVANCTRVGTMHAYHACLSLFLYHVTVHYVQYP